MYMNKLIQKICGEGTIFEDEQMRFNLATKLWNEIKSRYPDVDFDWIGFGFLDDKYIIARIDGRIIGAMNIDVYDENEEYPENADVEVDTEAENETEANVQPEEDGEEA